MIEILLPLGGKYLILQDQTSSIYVGDPDTIVEDLDSGSLLLETITAEYLQTEDLNLFIKE